MALGNAGTTILHLSIDMLFSKCKRNDTYILAKTDSISSLYSSQIACTSVAALLHYLYLTACMIMLADGIEFVLYVMYVFHVKRRKETVLLLATCYGKHNGNELFRFHSTCYEIYTRFLFHCSYIIVRGRFMGFSYPYQSLYEQIRTYYLISE